MNFKFFIALALLIFSSFVVKGQQELGLHFMKQVGQSAYTNPAFFSDYKVGINLASPYINLYNTTLVIDDFLRRVPGTDSLRLDFDPAIAKIKDDNFTFYNLHFDILHLTFQMKNWQYCLSYSLKSNGYGKYSKTFADVVWNGNSNYIGQNVELAPDFQTFHYHELAAGAAYKFDFGLSVGGRFKYLSGIADFSAKMDNQSIELFTDADIYQITLNTDYVIQSSSFPELDEDFQVVGNENIELFPHVGNFAKNSGFAIDLGFELNVGDKLSVAGSAINLGGTINWKENLNNYVSAGEFRYEGIDIGPLIEGDTLDFSAIGDTLSEIFELQTSTNTFGYKSTLATRYFLSASYEVYEDLRVGGLIYNETFRGHSHPSVAVYGQIDLFRDILRLGANASLRNGNTFNLGVNAIGSFGPVQLFASTDNILSVFSPYQNRNANIRAGLNLVFIKSNKGESILE